MTNKNIGYQEEIAYRELKKAITEGIYPPGYQVVERTLSALLGMSRSPVRSAIKRLESEGFLEHGTNHRIYVTLPSYDEIINTLYIRIALEGMAGRLAARNATETHFQELNSILHEMESHPKKGNELQIYHLSNQLHLKIIDSCGNPHLIQIAQNMYEKSTIYNFQIIQSPERMVQSIKEHREIVEKVIARDEDGAENSIRKHIQKVIDTHISYAQKQKQTEENRLLVSWKIPKENA